MKINLIHPWWVHLPAVVALLLYSGYLISILPLPATAPVQFGAGGIPVTIGSPWQSVGVIIGLSILFLGISILIDELWARQEKLKQFNWLTFLDDITIGAMTGQGLAYLVFLRDGGSYAFSHALFWPVVTGAVILALVLERARPYRPYHSPLQAEDYQPSG